MSLRPILEKILRLLADNPSAEHQAKLKTSVNKLESAATVFHEQLELADIENSVSFAKLAGLINDPAKKKIVNKAWANSHLQRLHLEPLSAKSFSALAKTQFLVRIMKAHASDIIIRELDRSEEEKLQDEFAQLSKLPESQAGAALTDFKPSKLEAFCTANGLSAYKKRAKSGKLLLDRKSTTQAVLAELAGFRERQRL